VRRGSGIMPRLFALAIGLLGALTAFSSYAQAIDGRPVQASPLTSQQPAASSPAERRKLFYIGLALYSESWSENDVVELVRALRQAADYDVVPLIASNFATSKHARYPIADDAAIATLVGTAAERARPGDIVFVNISTHGAPGVLASKVGSKAAKPLSAHALARRLAPLAGRSTLIVISACYSGSLIGDLRSPRWIIVTAARADRSSFGCAPGNRHTLFGEAELHGFAERGRSLRQVVAAIRDDVARRERNERYTPSEPQVSVGKDATELYDAKVF
jgi:peptidase C13-like protein